MIDGVDVFGGEREIDALGKCAGHSQKKLDDFEGFLLSVYSGKLGKIELVLFEVLAQYFTFVKQE